MKKITKLLAGITSAVMLTSIGTGGNFAASGVTLVPEISFELVADKTSFTRAEVEAGEAVAKVSFICNECDNDLVNSLWVDIYSSGNGMYFRNVQLAEPNAFTSDGGYGSLAMDFNLYDTAPDDLTELSEKASFYLTNQSEKFVKSEEENVVATFEVVFTEEVRVAEYILYPDYKVSGIDDGENVNDLNEYVKMPELTFSVGDKYDSQGFMTGEYAFDELNVAWSTDSLYTVPECIRDDRLICYNDGNVYEIYSKHYLLYIVPESEEAIKKLNLGYTELDRYYDIATKYAEGIPEDAVAISAKSREELDDLMVRAGEWLDNGYITYANAVEFMEYECRTGYFIQIHLKEADEYYTPQDYFGFEDVEYSVNDDYSIFTVQPDTTRMDWYLRELENDERVEKVELNCMYCCMIHRAVLQEDVYPNSAIAVPDNEKEAYEFYRNYGETIVTNGGKNAIVVLPHSTEKQIEDGFDVGYAYLDKNSESYTINSMEQHGGYWVYDITLNSNEDIQIDLPFINFKTDEEEYDGYANISLKYTALGDGTFTYNKIPLTEAGIYAAVNRGDEVIIEGNQAAIFVKDLVGWAWVKDKSHPLTAPEFVREDGCARDGTLAEQILKYGYGEWPVGGGSHTVRTYKFENDGEYIVTIEKGSGGEIAYTADYIFTMKDGVLTLESIEMAEPDPFAANIDPEAVEAAVWGDVNADGGIDVADIVSLNMYLLSPESVSLTDNGFVNANCSFDELIDSTDSTAIMNFVCMEAEYSSLGKQE